MCYYWCVFLCLAVQPVFLQLCVGHGPAETAIKDGCGVLQRDPRAAAHRDCQPPAHVSSDSQLYTNLVSTLGSIKYIYFRMTWNQSVHSGLRCLSFPDTATCVPLKSWSSGGFWRKWKLPRASRQKKRVRWLFVLIFLIYSWCNSAHTLPAFFIWSFFFHLLSSRWSSLLSCC